MVSGHRAHRQYKRVGGTIGQGGQRSMGVDRGDLSTHRLDCQGDPLTVTHRGSCSWFDGRVAQSLTSPFLVA